MKSIGLLALALTEPFDNIETDQAIPRVSISRFRVASAFVILFYPKGAPAFHSSSVMLAMEDYQSHSLVDMMCPSTIKNFSAGREPGCLLSPEQL